MKLEPVVSNPIFELKEMTRAFCELHKMPLLFGKEIPGTIMKLPVGEQQMYKTKCQWTPVNAVSHDPVNHPSHYTQGKIETIDHIRDKLA